ncbi:MAG: response regulator transcription factor [Acidobacteriota bacterium]
MIRTFIVDDQQLVREGLKSLLRLVEDVRVIGEAADGRGAIERVPEIAPDLLLLDLRMPGMGGVDVLRALQADGRLPPTLILTTFDDDDQLLASLRAGARGFLLKDVSLEQLTEAIRVVASGGTLIQPAVTERILRIGEGLENDFPSLEPPDPLTDRETDVLRLLAGGFSNREIAESLRVSEGTVKNHISNILSKLGVRDRTRAVLKGLELGLFGATP